MIEETKRYFKEKILEKAGVRIDFKDVNKIKLTLFKGDIIDQKYIYISIDKPNVNLNLLNAIYLSPKLYQFVYAEDYVILKIGVYKNKIAARMYKDYCQGTIHLEANERKDLIERTLKLNQGHLKDTIMQRSKQNITHNEEYIFIPNFRASESDNNSL